MSTVLGIWYVYLRVQYLSFSYFMRRHLVLEGGKDKTIETPACVQITNIAYGEEIADPTSRDVVKLSFESLTPPQEEDEEDEDEEEKEDDGLTIDTTVLCALTPGKVCLPSS